MVAHLVGGSPPVILAVGSSVGYNIRTAYLATGLSSLTVIVVVVPGAEARSMVTGSGWPAGTKIQLVNYGRISAPGGNGGSGANAQAGKGADGDPGGDALTLNWPISIDNGAGYIFGGGGGGGGGASPPGVFVGGGGGGGAQGLSGGVGGSGGTGSVPGSGGGSGSDTTVGAGGDGGAAQAGKGGVGGGWGNAGGAGGSGSYTPGYESAGGAAGYAVRTNGNAITWVAGYPDSARVKGPVGA